MAGSITALQSYLELFIRYFAFKKITDIIIKIIA